MKAFIAGGRGRVGSPLADNLEAQGIEVVSGGPEDGIDVISGKGLAEALVGVDTIVNVLNTPRFDAEGAISFFEGAINNLTAEGKRAGVRHHIVLSIVGVGEGAASEIGYYLGKVAQEKAARSSSISATIIRVTQFQSYIPVLIDQHTVEGKVLAPRTFIQPVDLGEVIRRGHRGPAPRIGSRRRSTSRRRWLCQCRASGHPRVGSRSPVVHGSDAQAAHPPS
ncbi:NAD(P)H-binding protein [Streptomyces sp. NPDC096191]|uniref:SDR family oxidoreductase n=1 Tax=Streptomyces sp. NPDC096191 TaxID=3155426 RepID=UPI00331EE11C